MKYQVYDERGRVWNGYVMVSKNIKRNIMTEIDRDVKERRMKDGESVPFPCMNRDYGWCRVTGSEAAQKEEGDAE